jgi:hypothetical protein
MWDTTMNIVYYLTSTMLKDKEVAVSGGHGYTYDPAKESTRKLVKDAPSGFGYFVNGSLQSIPVDQVGILSGRTLRQKSEHEAFLANLVELLEWAKTIDLQKLLVITSSVNGMKIINAKQVTEKWADNPLVKRARELVKELGDKVIFDLEYWPKGGEGCKQATKQHDFAKGLLELPSSPDTHLDICTAKEFKNPENDFNKLVNASRWFFNTGDKSEFFKSDENGYRQYGFGRIDPDKGYYGKATPDVYYSALFTKTPISVLDKLYAFCQNNKPNPYNMLAAANLDMVKSKEISRIIDIMPGTIDKDKLMANMAIGANEDPVLVDFINPPGLSYRIRDFQDALRRYHSFFLQRDIDGKFKSHQWVDITDRIFEQDAKGKWKINAGFTQNTLTIPVKIDAPGCVKPVTINMGVRYDMPDRSAFNSLIVGKVPEFKVYVGLDFCDPAGVAYYTMVETPDFNYIHANSCANLRVYNLKELGRSE